MKDCCNKITISCPHPCITFVCSQYICPQMCTCDLSRVQRSEDVYVECFKRTLCTHVMCKTVISIFKVNSGSLCSCYSNFCQSLMENCLKCKHTFLKESILTVGNLWTSANTSNIRLCSFTIYVRSSHTFESIYG